MSRLEIRLKHHSSVNHSTKAIHHHHHHHHHHHPHHQKHEPYRYKISLIFFVNNVKFINMKYNKKVNRKTYKNISNSTFIIRQTFIIRLHNTSNICKLQLVISKTKKRNVLIKEICKQLLPINLKLFPNKEIICK